MSYDWTEIPLSDPLHPRLEPVSAWLFQENSAFLRTGDPASDAAALYSMPIAAAGFAPEFGPTWRAMSVPNPRGDAENAGARFTELELQSDVDAQSTVAEDPQVFVLPLPRDSLMDANDLRRRMQLGTARRQRPRTPLSAPQAIVGIIDHGINIFHHRFRRGADSSRVAYAWDQSAARTRDRLPFGREWILSDIETALIEAGGDEDALIRTIGGDFGTPGFHPLGYRTSHGTHVLDLAAGFEPDDTEGHDLPIVAVTLPPEVTRETTGSFLALPFSLGLEYIADRARHIFYDTNTVVPVYVNFSFGLSGGPRDGLHRLEQTIARVAAHHQNKTHELFPGADAPFSVVCAAGNNNLAQGHARGPDNANNLALNWNLQPADTTSNFLELRIALPPEHTGGAVQFNLALTPPLGGPPQQVSLSVVDGRDVDSVRWFLRDGDVIGRLSAWVSEVRIITLTLVLAPTDPGMTGATPCAPGTWGVALTCQNVTPARMDAWILRDNVPGGFRDTGRQSYFVDSAYTARDVRGFPVAEDVEQGAQITRAGGLNALATGARPVANVAAPSQTQVWVVGAAQKTGAGPDAPLRGATDYSAAPLDTGSERVDVSALGDCSSVTPGVLAAGTRSGSRVALSGTSVAAPQVVRAFATGTGSFQPPEEAPSARLGTVLTPARSRR